MAHALRIGKYPLRRPLVPPLGCLALPSPAPAWACSELLSEPEEDARDAAADGKAVWQPPIAALVLLSQTIPRPSAPAFLSCQLISAETPPEQQLSPKFLSYPPPELAWAVWRHPQPSKCSNGQLQKSGVFS